MGFRSVGAMQASRFNSSVSAVFLDQLEDFIQDEVNAKNSEPKSKTFAPSSFRCMRKNWFRLRGTEPDKVQRADVVTDHTAKLGEACHTILQSRISKMLGENWISVKDYLAENPVPHKYTLSEHGFETRVEFHDIPVRFACDGILKINGEYYLLEIKSSEDSSFNGLTQWKDEHLDQTKCYMRLLGLKKVLFLYVDRLYGNLKCYEYAMTLADESAVDNTFDTVIKCAQTNIAPKRLPRGDKWCGMCEYKNSCQKWG